MQLGVEAIVSQQLQVRTALGDPAAIEHQNAIGLFDRGEPMSNDERRAMEQQLRERRLDVPL